MSGHRGVGWGGKKITQTADFMYFPCAECKETRLQKWRFWRLVDYVNYPDQDRYTYCRSTSMCIYIYTRICRSLFRFLKSIYVPLEGMICLKRQSSWVGISGFLVAECVGNPRTQWWICGAESNWFFCEASGPFLKLKKSTWRWGHPFLGWPCFPLGWKQIDKEGMGTAVDSLEDIMPYNDAAGGHCYPDLFATEVFFKTM